MSLDATAPLAEYISALQAAAGSADGLPGDDAQALFTLGAGRLLVLKRAHRELCEQTEALREAASEAKVQLDQSSLVLQNLLYERQHYEKEIASCRTWRSAYSDEQIALVPVAEFAAHPLALEKGLAGGDSPHQLMLNRLAHEVAYRQEFVKRLEGVKAQRDALAAAVAQKRGTVAGLEGEVGKLLAAARSVQEQYAVKAAESGRQPGEAVDSPAGATAAAATAVAAAAGGDGGGDADMREAGQL